MWGAWSEWWWEDSQQCWCRARQNTQGRLEYDYKYPDAQGQAAPRGDVDSLADAMGQASISGYQVSSYYNQESYTYDPQAVAGSASPAVIAHGTTSALQPQPAPQASKGKSRAAAEPSASRKSRAHKESSRTTGHSSRKARQPGASTTYTDDYTETVASHNFQDPFYKKLDSSKPKAPQPDHPSGADDPGEQDAHYPTQAEEQGNYGIYPPPQDHPAFGVLITVTAPLPPREEPSFADETEAGDQPHNHDLPSIDAYGTGTVDPTYSTAETASVTTAYSYSTIGADDDRRNTPTPPAAYQPAAAPSTGGSRYAPRGSHYPPSSSQYTTNGFVVEHSSKFQPGEIFKIMWTEPLGNGGRRSERPTQHLRLEHNGVQFYQGLRRFIVVANDQGNCTCVPILTYERQGCKKRGVKPLKHGIIHQSGRRPRTLPDEPRLGFDPVRVNMYEMTEQLVKESRVNYAKLTTIEHNVPVLFIGSVVPDDFNNIVSPAVDACWQDKMRRRGKERPVFCFAWIGLGGLLPFRISLFLVFPLCSFLFSFTKKGERRNICGRSRFGLGKTWRSPFHLSSMHHACISSHRF
ncbi:hypothetical protein C8A05DRAFT_12304 [Staphylotrichum tortipilum]|uniref:DUF6590 domain-containing protein n=1 Tax=Staphylotrichum tortipilum TaxID=2831512 RepID=A0AAN6MRX6_9PEZI|nr:hypothetical protein C8A05DRAFT_12304 [Staphylotrichum longicolle]